MATVLVVDDDPLITSMLDRFIGSLGHKVVCAHNGIDAVRLALQHRPPLVFFDMEMPGVNAFEILEELRRFSRTRHTQVVMMSESPEQSERESTARRCGTGYVTKPIVLRDVLGHLNAFAVEGAA